MAYETPNGTTTAQAVDFSEAVDEDGPRVEVLLRTASRVVTRLAPPPEEEDEDYRQAASDCELLIFDYLASTRGFVRGESLSGVASESFADDAGVMRIVADSMGEYYGSAGGVVKVGRWPR